MSEYIVLEVSERNHVVAKKVVGYADKYSAIATCRSRHQAQGVVNLLNGAGDVTLDMVKQFHEAFGIDSPTERGVPGVDNPTIAAVLKQGSGKLKEIAEGFHSRAAFYKSEGLETTALLRLQLMVEELAEVCQAMAEGDIAACLHELADLRYVVDGTVLALGLADVYVPAVKEVHRANMSKLDENGKPILNDAGRVVKSKLFKKADVRRLVA